MEKVLIAGCGYVGTRLAEILAADGYSVFGLKRRNTSLPKGVKLIRADLSDLTTFDNLPSEIDYLIYSLSADEHSDESYKNAYVTCLRNIVKFYQDNKTKIKKLIYISSTGVYAQEDGSWVDETSTTNSEHFTGNRLLQGEEVLKKTPWDYTIIRFAGIYGPKRERLINQIAEGKLKYTLGKAYTNRIHQEDCAHVIKHLMLKENDENKIYIGVDSEPIDLNEIITWTTNFLGLAPAEMSIKQEVNMLRGNKRCSNKLLLNSGYTFIYPSFREGFRAILER